MHAESIRKTPMEKEGSIDDNSHPIEQVRLTVPATDDPTLPVLTLRTWLVGIPLCVMQAVMSRVGAFRQQFVILSGICVNIMALLGGRFLANVLPNKKVRIPFTRWSFSLNPGPFNVKEHVAIAMMVSAAGGIPSFASVSISKIFYSRDVHPVPALLLVLSTQLIGFGFAGIFMKFLVESPYMWWPGNLVSVSFYRALHEPEKRPKGKASRYQFFFMVAVASFAYGIVPAYFFPSITAMSFMCWIWRDSVVAQQIGSGMKGLGVGSFGLDWMTITAFLGSPLVNPAFVLFNMMAGFILIVYLAVPVSYWTNTYSARRFPLISIKLFDADGQEYNVSRILDAKTLTFNEDAYNEYSKIHFSVYLVYRYGFALAAFTSSLSYVALYHGRSVWKRLKSAYHRQEQDIHTRIMRENYKPVPRWWYYSILFTMIVFAILVCEGFGDQVQLRYWEVLLACALVFIFLLPAGVLAATANFRVEIEMLLAILIGYLHPGKPIANLTFENFGSIAHMEAISLAESLKLSQYMKVPPKIVFSLQLLSCALSCFLDFGIAWWMIYSIENICRPELLPEGSPWTCPAEKAMFAYGVTWGLVGPSKMFYPHGMYSAVFLFVLVGFLAPFPTWMLSQKYPDKKWIRLINWPVIFGVAYSMSVVRPVIFWSYMIVGLAFNYFIYEKHKSWWGRYNYVLSAGLDTGAAFLTLVLTTSLQFQGVYGMNWWGLETGDHCSLASCPTATGVNVEGCPVAK